VNTPKLYATGIFVSPKEPLAATWPDIIKGAPDYHTDGTHGGNRPPTDGSGDNNIGYDDLARHK
jgi:hypothetical protein